jgi:tetratricopeptide (TPR) repeat protein
VMKVHRVVLLVAAVSLVACSTREPAPSAETHAADPPTQGDTDRVLALAPATGGGATDVTIASLQASVGRNPAKADYWVLLGRVWIKKARESSDPGYYAHADACARIALAAAPGNRLALDLQAMVLLNDHKFEAARQLAASVTAARPDDPMAYATLSDALLELGRFDEAAAATQMMVDIKPNLPSYSRAAYLRWLKGDVRASKEIVRKAIDAGGDTRDPEPLAWVLVQAAMIFWHEGDYAGADAGFDRALAVQGEFPPALVGKARVALASGAPAEAALLLTRAYRASPLAETAWLLGDAERAAGHDALGQAAYANVRREGGRSDARTLSLFLSTENRDPELALRLAEAELKVRRDPYTEDTYAWALYRNGRMLEAKEAAARATRFGTKDARLLYHEGAILMAAGEAARGRVLVREALALNPHFDVTGAAHAAALLGAS